MADLCIDGQPCAHYTNIIPDGNDLRATEFASNIHPDGRGNVRSALPSHR